MYLLVGVGEVAWRCVRVRLVHHCGGNPLSIPPPFHHQRHPPTTTTICPMDRVMYGVPLCMLHTDG